MPTQNGTAGLTYNSQFGSNTFGNYNTGGTFSGGFGSYGGGFTDTSSTTNTNSNSGGNNSGGFFQDPENISAVGGVLQNVLVGIGAIKNGNSPQQISYVNGQPQPITTPPAKGNSSKTVFLILGVVAVVGLGIAFLLRKKKEN